MFVSIIIPTYNRAVMVAEAISSALAQDHKDKEIIVVDDGSTDDTQDVVVMSSPPPAFAEGKLQRGSSPVKYLRIENSGVSRARNVGIAEAKGDLIAFLDSDDLWLPGKLSYQVDFLKRNPDIHVCQTEELWMRNGKRVNPRGVHKKHSGWIFEHCIPLCIVSPSAVMMRRGVLDDVGLFDESMPICEDYDLWLRIAPKYQMVTLPEPMIVKRGGHLGQLSKKWGQDIWRIYALQKVLKAGIGDARLEDMVRKDIARRALIVAQGAKKRGKEDVFKQYTALALNYSANL